MKKFYTLVLLLLSLAASLQATRPLRLWFAQKQSDGTCLKVTKAGNEHLNYYITEDFVPVLRGSNGDLCYAIVSGDKLVATAQTAHDKTLRNSAEQALVTELKAGNEAKLIALEMANAREQYALNAAGNTANGLGVYGQANNGAVASIGAPVIPVVMIDFPDLPFQSYTTQEKVSRMFNEAGYSDEKYSAGSIRDYFSDQSQGLFTPSFVVVAKVRASKGFASYGYAKGNSATRSLIKEAIDSAEAHGVDFTAYTNEAGAVPLVSIYYAGVGAHSCYEADANDHIWAHFSTWSTTTANKVPVKSYFVGNELYTEYTLGSNYEPVVKERRTDGIGVFCHEFGHALGLPDFYYTLSNATIADTLCSMDFWSVMDYGQYYANGYRPLGYNAFERSMLGWQRITDLQPGTDDGYHKLNPFARESEDSASCYRLANPANDKEYFLVENRQPGKWYPAGMGSGLLALHVDYDATAWSNNRVNALPDHQRMTYVPADGQKQGPANNGKFPDCANDLFGGKSEVYELSQETMGGWTAFYTPTDKSTSAAPLFDISQDNGIVSFCFNNKELVGISHINASTGIKSESEWYTLDGRKVPAPTRPGIYLHGKQKVLLR